MTGVWTGLLIVTACCALGTVAYECSVSVNLHRRLAELEAWQGGDDGRGGAQAEIEALRTLAKAAHARVDSLGVAAPERAVSATSGARTRKSPVPGLSRPATLTADYVTNETPEPEPATYGRHAATRQETP